METSSIQQTSNKYNSKGITKFSTIESRKAENQQPRGGRRATYKYKPFVDNLLFHTFQINQNSQNQNQQFDFFRFCI